MSRGGREGNNALTKDSDLRMTHADYVTYALTQNVPQKTINEMIALKMSGGKAPSKNDVMHIWFKFEPFSR